MCSDGDWRVWDRQRLSWPYRSRAASPDGVRRDLRGTRKRTKCLQRRSVRSSAGRRLKLAAAAPVAPWAGTRKADTFAPACMQEGVSMPGEHRRQSVKTVFASTFGPGEDAHRAASSHRLDLWRRIQERIRSDAALLGRSPRPQRCDCSDNRLSTRSARLSCATRAHARIRRTLLRKLRSDGSDRRAGMGSAQHCSIWRRPEKRDHRRSVFRSHIGQRSDGLAACERAVPARDRRERRSVRAVAARPKIPARQCRARRREVCRIAGRHLARGATPTPGDTVNGSGQRRWHDPPGDRAQCAAGFTLRHVRRGPAERCTDPDRLKRRGGSLADRCVP